jgi:hypothetical protein
VAALEESLRVARELGYPEGAAYSLLGLASASQESRRASVLLGASERLADEVGLTFQSTERELYDETLARLRSATGFEEAREQGQGLSLEQAVEFALQEA